MEAEIDPDHRNALEDDDHSPPLASLVAVFSSFAPFSDVPIPVTISERSSPLRLLKTSANRFSQQYLRQIISSSKRRRVYFAVDIPQYPGSII